MNKTEIDRTRATRRRTVTGLMLFAFGIVTLFAGKVVQAGATVSEAAPAAIQELVIKTVDYAFDMAESVRPGLTRVKLTNSGKEPHHVWMIRLEDGKGLKDLFDAVKHGEQLPSWAKHVGGPNALAGSESVALMDLQPGTYAVLCFIPSADGKPHVMKGMAKELRVAGTPFKAPLPRIDVEGHLTDYDFAFSQPIKAGLQRIRFTNDAGQPHEAFIAKLVGDAKPEDFLKWLSHMDGPPPAIPMGGITGIEPKADIIIEQTFTPGRYALYCFVPDVRDGKEHVHHGMMKEFTVGN